MTLTPATVAAIQTTIAAGTCLGCGYVTAVQDTTRATRTARCGGCNTPVRLDYVRGSYSADEPCNDQCQYATGPACSCACGGTNHRAGYIAGADMIPVWVRDRDRDRHAAKVAAAETKRVAARVAADARRADMIDETPALGMLAGDRYAGSANGFILDMRARVAAGDELSPRQLAAVIRIVAEDAARDRARTDRETAEAAARAAGVQHPTGKRITFTGTITSAKRHVDDRFNYHGTTTIKIVVRSDDGWAVYGTAPRAMYPNGYTTDTFQAWLEALPGQRVTLTADIAAGRDGNPLFGVFKRPTVGEPTRPATVRAPRPARCPAGSDPAVCDHTPACHPVPVAADDQPCGCPAGPAPAEPSPEAAAFAARVDRTGGELDAAVAAHRTRPTVGTHGRLLAAGQLHAAAIVREDTAGYQARTHAPAPVAPAAPFVSRWGAPAGG